MGACLTFLCSVLLLCPTAGYHVSLNMSQKKQNKTKKHTAMWHGPPATRWQEEPCARLIRHEHDTEH